MKSSSTLLLALSLLLVDSRNHAASRTASLGGHGHSFNLGATDPLFFSGYGNVTHYFTTPDGRTDQFPRHDIVDGLVWFSQEMVPVGGGKFAGDYASYASFVGWIDQGYFTMNAPTTDSDSNGLADWLQVERSVNASISGTLDSDIPSEPNLSYTGNLQRGANQTRGNYSVSIPATGNTYNGDWYVVHISGSASYDRSNNSMTLSIQTVNAFGESYTLTSQSFTYTINDENQITLPQFTLSGSGPTLPTTGPVTLQRSGDRYHGVVHFTDGEQTTSWADFTTYTVEIFDDNDEDGDGIPSLSDATPDAPPPSLTLQKQGGSLLITWPTSAPGFQIQHSSDLNTWSTPPESPIQIGDQQALLIAPAPGARIFRLKKP